MKPVTRWLGLAVVACALVGCSDKKAEAPKEYAPPPSGLKGGLKGGEPASPPAQPPKPN
jgi:hypothetical protein